MVKVVNIMPAKNELLSTIDMNNDVSPFQSTLQKLNQNILDKSAAILDL